MNIWGGGEDKIEGNLRKPTRHNWLCEMKEKNSC
jgi:hypothetical protein